LSTLKVFKCCELMKLCHINRRGPVFFRHMYIVQRTDVFSALQVSR